MSNEIQTMHGIINNFLSGHLDAESFEEKFTDIFDLSDMDIPENNLKYFQKIRELLEHYSFSKEDIKLDPNFFINSKQLKDEIYKLQKQV